MMLLNTRNTFEILPPAWILFLPFLVDKMCTCPLPKRAVNFFIIAISKSESIKPGTCLSNNSDETYLMGLVAKSVELFVSSIDSFFFQDLYSS